jgi:hypothetical protein
LVRASATSCGGTGNGDGNLSFAVRTWQKGKKNCKLLNGGIYRNGNALVGRIRERKQCTNICTAGTVKIVATGPDVRELVRVSA